MSALRPLPALGALALLPVLGLRCGDNDACPDGMVRIAGGRVQLGLDSPAQPYERPSFEAELAPYCIDVYEYPNQLGTLPEANVTWREARGLCGEQGKRLCTADEWEHACRGRGQQRYGYGAERDADACNTPRERFDEAPGHPLAASGAHPRCRTPQGVIDLNGNLSEWVEDPWHGHKPRFEEEAFPAEETYRTVRGGTMWRQTFYGQDCLSAHGHPETVRHVDDGFRCCSDPR